MRTRTVQARYQHIAADGTTTDVTYDTAPVGTIVKSQPGKLRISLTFLDLKSGRLAIRSNYPGRAQSEQVVRQATVRGGEPLVAEFEVALPTGHSCLVFQVVWHVEGGRRTEQNLVWLPE